MGQYMGQFMGQFMNIKNRFYPSFADKLPSTHCKKNCLIALKNNYPKSLFECFHASVNILTQTVQNNQPTSPTLPEHAVL